ncbi:hypothetical protein Cni_G26235 [Canna indica]|uniref:Uncharacterized protein n=1 Tax=Canna indica TaxID=4628 RepID=A0AAQ3QQ28_9LILI|nr:hypothetical protein Cni_G26235 [Canna indica]
MESKFVGEDGSSDNIFSIKEDDSCSCIAASGFVESRECKEKSASIETSNLLGSNSPHDLSLEYAVNKDALGASLAHEKSENIVKSENVILDAVEENNFLQEKTCSADGSPFS